MERKARVAFAKSKFTMSEVSERLRSRSNAVAFQALDRLEARPPYPKDNNQQQPQLHSRIERVDTVASPPLEIPVDILGLETLVLHSSIIDHHDTPVS